MSKLAEIDPAKSRGNLSRMIDLVEAAGVDVSDWSNLKGGKKNASRNPKYCFEWSFVEPKKVVVLNLWHDFMEEYDGGIIMRSLNMREFASERPPPEKGRSLKMDEAIQTAIKEKLPIRVIVLDGSRRSASNLARPSHVSKRLLDPVTWTVAEYNWQNGDCVLKRGADRFVDQSRFIVSRCIWLNDGVLLAKCSSEARQFVTALFQEPTASMNGVEDSGLLQQTVEFIWKRITS